MNLRSPHETDRPIAFVVFIFCWLLLFSLTAVAQETVAPLPIADGKKAHVSIDFNEVDIHVFIKFVSELTGRNFVVDQRVKGKVTIISPGRISVREAYKVFESVLEVHGFAAVTAGEIVKIVPSPDARAKSIETRLRTEVGPNQDSVITQIIRLQYAQCEEIKRLFTPLVSKNSVVLTYAATNTLIITDVSSNIHRLLNILKVIDVAGIGREISVVPLQFASADKMVKLLESIFKSPHKNGKKEGPDTTARLIADDRTNTIVVMASEDDTKRVLELARMLDKKMQRGKEQFNVYYLEHAIAEDLAKILQDLVKSQTRKVNGSEVPVVSEKVNITADKATNSLIIMADKDDYGVLENIMSQLDIPRSMVYIEALIMEVNVDKDFRLGTEWAAGAEASYDGTQGIAGGGFSGGAGGGDPGFINLPQIPVDPENPAAGTTAGVPLPPGFSLGIFGEALSIGGFTFPSISAVVQAYKKDKDVNILSTPQILTTDNEEAKITVGKNVPFQTKATTTNNDTFNSFEYRDVGKTLKITPHVTKDRLVRLNISLEVTALESTTDFRPTTLKRTVDTTVIVQDSNTVVIGGLIDDTITTTTYRVPCLGDIPGLGWLFKSASDTGAQTNLFVFLTPRVIRSATEAEAVYRSKKDQIDAIESGSIKMYNEKEEGILPAF